MSHLIVNRIVLSHHFISQPGWYSDEYALARRYSGIVYVLEGYAKYTMGDGTRFSIREGDCLYVPQGAVYTIRCNQSERFVHMTVNFELQGEGDPFSLPTRQRLRSPVHFEQLFTRLIHHWTVRHPHYHERCTGILYEMLYLLLSEIQSPGGAYIDKLRPARAYLDAHFQEDFPLEILPGLCDLSETYFRRLFRRTFSETPAEYRRRLRIAYAEDLLLSGQFTISEVARQCGYPDAAYFSRVFHQTLGVSPSQYAMGALSPEENR